MQRLASDPLTAKKPQNSIVIGGSYYIEDLQKERQERETGARDGERVRRERDRGERETRKRDREERDKRETGERETRKSVIVVVPFLTV